MSFLFCSESFISQSEFSLLKQKLLVMIAWWVNVLFETVMHQGFAPKLF